MARERERRGKRGGGGEDDQEREGWMGEDGSPRERGIRGKRMHDFQEIAIQIKFFHLLSSLQESGTLSMPTSTMTVTSQPLLLV